MSSEIIVVIIQAVSIIFFLGMTYQRVNTIDRNVKEIKETQTKHSTDITILKTKLDV